jgi:undecaprenyl-diphosphatase
VWCGGVTFLEAVLLGVVQGLFMFLPVSSTAHLVITQHLLIRNGSGIPAPESPEMILFDLVVHVGTLVSIVVVFHKSLRIFLTQLFGETRDFVSNGGGPARGTLFIKLALMGLLTVFVTGVLGLTFKALLENVFATPAVLTVTLTITGILLWITDRLPARRIGLRGIGPRIAVTVGVAQALSLMPGLSRSGMTICFSLFSGLKRRWAAEFSFLVAFPTILAATLVQSLEVFSGLGLGGVSVLAMVTGFVVAAAVGVVALKLVLALLYRAQLKIFSFYLWGLAGVVAFGFLDHIYGL